MTACILCLHHVTATVAEAVSDLRWYRDLLGLRLVKRTVNFDNPAVHHFYYGNRTGSPGSVFTTFPYAGHRVREGTRGAGQIESTRFSVPAGALPFWKERLGDAGVAVTPNHFLGEESLRCQDPAGLILTLVASVGDARPAWTGEVEPVAAIQGLHSVVLPVRDPDASLRFLAEVLGGVAGPGDQGATRVHLGLDRPGHWVDVVSAGDRPEGVNGIGTVHHVAFAVSTPAEQVALREELLRRGVKVTEVLDRKYFQSIYFREPGGILYEVATTGPGFTVDEPVESMGSTLCLPSWLEDRREEIREALA